GGIFLLGLGLVVLVGVVYALFGIGWVEVHRVGGLYGLDVPALTLRRPAKPGFGGYLESIGRQSIDGRMRRSVASFAIGAFLGSLLFGLVRGAVWLIVALTAGAGAGASTALGRIFGADSADAGGQGWIIAASILGLIIIVAGAIGLALLSRAVSIAL